MLAKIASADELMLSDDEASEYARALSRMDRHFNVLGKVSPVWVDAWALASVMGGIYAPKIMALKLRRDVSRAHPRATSPQDAAPPVRPPSPNGAAPRSVDIPGVGPALNIG
jgi:hypothetical protein